MFNEYWFTILVIQHFNFQSPKFPISSPAPGSFPSQPDFDDPKDVDLTIEDFDLNWLLNGGAFVEMMQSLRLGAQLDRPAVTAALKNKGQTTHAAVVLKGFWRVVVKNGHEPYRWRLPNQPGGGRAGDTAGAVRFFSFFFFFRRCHSSFSSFTGLLLS